MLLQATTLAFVVSVLLGSRGGAGVSLVLLGVSFLV
jgi:hypothetical protein